LVELLARTEIYGSREMNVNRKIISGVEKPGFTPRRTSVGPSLSSELSCAIPQAAGKYLQSSRFRKTSYPTADRQIAHM
jgi:hypothetical protein